jgi:Ala-tRNA(Pro) deacylase
VRPTPLRHDRLENGYSNDRNAPQQRAIPTTLTFGKPNLIMDETIEIPSVFMRLSGLLTSRGVPFDVLHHAPVFTSAEAAAVRGTVLASGAKALICKVDERFVMIVLPADRKLDSKALRKSLGCKSIRFASSEEVLSLTLLKPGSIPPFGSLFELPTYCDERLGEHEKINFNAGDHAISISLRYSDYLLAETPKLGQFAE